ncbi:MAG: hypothetical protein K2J67_03785, partial [Lachnospiraceae bacterium]|nr:hypothetical protein [Lachnospiraceae bacterium]
AMGESLSVKGAQIAYYVPSDFVTASTTKSTVNPGSRVIKFHFNSDLTTEYTFDYGGYMKYLYGLDPNTATDAQLDSLAGSDFNILTYLDQNQPLEKYYRHDTAVQTDSVTYYYLNFKDDTQLMAFYPNFQKYVPRYSTVKDTNAAYMGATGISINAGIKVYNYSGNVLYRDPASGDTDVIMGNESSIVDSQALQKYAREKNKEYLSRQLALVENYQTANDMVDVVSPAVPQYRLLNADVNLSKSGTSDSTNVYNLLIDATQMATKTTLYKGVNNSGTGVIIIEPRASETYTWNASEMTSLGGLNCGIIIAAGNVKVSKDFSGLIIAGGDITFSVDNVKVTADSILLEKMFKEDKSSASPKFYNLFSQYFQKVVNSAIGQEDNATKDVVFYERWKKE